ncbi:hypothetical protein ACQJBY_027262 [Aegilops geniculata]
MFLTGVARAPPGPRREKPASAVPTSPGEASRTPPPCLPLPLLLFSATYLFPLNLIGALQLASTPDPSAFNPVSSLAHSRRDPASTTAHGCDEIHHSSEQELHGGCGLLRPPTDDVRRAVVCSKDILPWLEALFI